MIVFVDVFGSLGHTSVEYEGFRQSMRAEKNEYTDRYVRTDSVWEEPEGSSGVQCGILCDIACKNLDLSKASMTPLLSLLLPNN